MESLNKRLRSLRLVALFIFLIPFFEAMAADSVSKKRSSTTVQTVTSPKVVAARPRLSQPINRVLGSQGETNSAISDQEEIVNTWSPEKKRYSIGYEGAALAAASVIGKNAINFGWWLDDSWGIDTYFGYSKDADTYSETTTQTNDAVANSSVVNTKYGGLKNPSRFILGAGLRYRLFQNSWFQFNVGGLLTYSPSSSSSSASGATTITTPNIASPGNKTTTDDGLGTISSQTDSTISIGPKLSTEFYLRWIPHLALGFSTGILTAFGGDSTVTTTTRSRTYSTINGTAQPPSSDTTSSSVASLKQGMRGVTFGIGGTQFQLVGTFTIRYLW